jgi:hypothetical protein
MATWLIMIREAMMSVAVIEMRLRRELTQQLRRGSEGIEPAVSRS